MPWFPHDNDMDLLKVGSGQPSIGSSMGLPQEELAYRVAWKLAAVW